MIEILKGGKMESVETKNKSETLIIPIHGDKIVILDGSISWGLNNKFFMSVAYFFFRNVFNTC